MVLPQNPCKNDFSRAHIALCHPPASDGIASCYRIQTSHIAWADFVPVNSHTLYKLTPRLTILVHMELAANKTAAGLERLSLANSRQQSQCRNDFGQNSVASEAGTCCRHLLRTVTTLARESRINALACTAICRLVFSDSMTIKTMSM